MKAKLQNFWYYYKIYVIIFLVLLAAGIYFLTQQKPAASDYDAAIIIARECSDEQVSKIRTVLEQAGEDQNGDGTVIVNVHVFRFAIGEDGQNIYEIAGLDADLVGKTSGLFFTEDPNRFESATNGIGQAGDAIPVCSIPLLSGLGIDDLNILIRTDADEKYALLVSALTGQ